MTFLGDLIAKVDVGFQRVRDEFNTLRGQTMLADDDAPLTPRDGQRYFSLRGWCDMVYVTSLGWIPVGQYRVDLATTGNVSLSGTGSIDGVSYSAGTLILVRAQTDKTENGVYRCVGAGAWVRESGFDVHLFQGTEVVVKNGTLYAHTVWAVQDNVNVQTTFGDQIVWNMTGRTDGQTIGPAAGSAAGSISRSRVAAQTITDSTWQILQTDTSDWIDSGYFAVNASGAIQCLVAGVYDFDVTAQFVANVTGRRLLRLYKNNSPTAVQTGTLVDLWESNPSLTGSGVGPSAKISGQVTCAVGDYLLPQVWQNSTNAGGLALTVSATKVQIRMPKPIEVIKPATTSRQITASLRQTAAGTTMANATNIKIAFDTVQHDTNAIADLANNRLVIKTAGYYELRGVISFGVPSSGAQAGIVQSRITVNGVEMFVGRQGVLSSNTTGQYGVVAEGDPLLLAVGDVIELYGQHTNGAGITKTTLFSPTAGFTSLSCWRVSDAAF